MEDDKESFITVYQTWGGWNSVMMWWNAELGGYWEPWQTGMGPYDTREEAVRDGKSWAIEEKLEFMEG